MPPFVDDLLAQSTQLLSAKSSEEILELTCKAVQRLAGLEVVFGSFAESAAWAAGVHLRFHASERFEATPAQRSALFAVHRAVTRTRSSTTLARPTFHTVIDALCGTNTPSSTIDAFPIMHRRGQLGGCLALCVSVPLGEEAKTLVIKLVALASLAFDNVQRISFARRDRERLNLIAEAAEEALWDWSPDTGEFWWGGGVQSLIGDVVVQSRLSWKFEQIHSDDKERVRQSFEHALAAADVETWREEYRQLRTDGSWIHVEDHAHILRDSSGRAHRVVGALRDVTELRALLAREHAARTEAESASLAKDEFLAMLGHELRNPLAPILTALHLMRLQDANTFTREREIIERQIRHVSRLVDDMLDVSRITRGKVSLETEIIEVSAAVTKAVEMAEPAIDARGHRVKVDVPGTGLLIDADPVRVNQVIANLLTNAARYMQPGGLITVRARREQAEVVIDVIDTGIGLNPELLPHIFDLFVQGSQTLQRSEGGLGLGLALVKNLVTMHGGSVSAHSEGVGHGSRFTVRLPAHQGAASASESGRSVPPSAPTPAPRTSRILLVDDNADAIDTLADVLRSAGYEVLVAYDGPQALIAMETFEVDVAIIDIGLPVMDGYELARRIRQGHKVRRLIAITGYGQGTHQARSQEAGFDEHLVKPVSVDRVMLALNPPGGVVITSPG